MNRAIFAVAVVASTLSIGSSAKPVSIACQEQGELIDKLKEYFGGTSGLTVYEFDEEKGTLLMDGDRMESVKFTKKSIEFLRTGETVDPNDVNVFDSTVINRVGGDFIITIKYIDPNGKVLPREEGIKARKRPFYFGAPNNIYRYGQCTVFKQLF